MEGGGSGYTENKRHGRVVHGARDWAITTQNTPRDDAEHREGKADAQGTGERRTQHHPPGNGRGLVCGLGRPGGERECG